MLFLSKLMILSKLLHLHLLKIVPYLLHKCPKDKENACQHPGLYGSQTLSLGCVGSDIVENVD